MINKPNNWDEFEESEVVSGDSLKPGPYPIQIKEVTDIPEKEYLEIKFDIVKDVKYKNYFENLKERLELENWPNQGIYRASYKETATKFFKAFITAVQKSNQGYVWNWNPTSLIGKYVVANFGEEEYEWEGEIRTSVKVREIRSIEAWQKGDVNVLPIKKIKKQEKKSFVEIINTPIDDDDLPF